MAITTIPWGDGSGDNIYLSAPSQTGDQSVSVTSDPNTGAARSKVVTFSASGVSPVSLTITQDAGSTPQQYTLTLNPSFYDTDDHSYASMTNPANAYTSENTTKYCQINLLTGTEAETWMYFGFDTSSIPAGATIDSVVCTAKTYVNTNVTNVPTREWQLFTGTTPKGSAVSIPSASAGIDSVSGATWTAAEIANIRLRMYARRGTANVNTSSHIRLYGATLTITYTI